MFSEGTYAVLKTDPFLILYDELNSKIRSLNEKLREIFDLVYDWFNRSLPSSYISNRQCMVWKIIFDQSFVPITN